MEKRSLRDNGNGDAQCPATSKTAAFHKTTLQFARSLLSGRISTLAALAAMSTGGKKGVDAAVHKLSSETKAKPPKEITDTEWKSVLSSEQFYVTRKAGTERPFSGKYDKHFAPGKYTCICCGADLFLSDAKYNSGCGWPAFFKSVEGDKNIVRIPDNSTGYERIEIRCKQCNAHLGHVFPDGPRDKTGERYCVNSAAINFAAKSDGE